MENRSPLAARRSPLAARRSLFGQSRATCFKTQIAKAVNVTVIRLDDASKSGPKDRIVFSAVFESFSSSSSSAVFWLAGTGEDGRGISGEF
jgi:hypothetical protein